MLTVLLAISCSCLLSFPAIFALCYSYTASTASQQVRVGQQAWQFAIHQYNQEIIHACDMCFVDGVLISSSVVCRPSLQEVSRD